MAKQRVDKGAIPQDKAAIPQDMTAQGGYAHRRGEIKDNHLQALLGDPLFRCRVECSKRGKGSYRRKGKHGKGWEPAQQQMVRVCC